MLGDAPPAPAKASQEGAPFRHSFTPSTRRRTFPSRGQVDAITTVAMVMALTRPSKKQTCASKKNESDTAFHHGEALRLRPACQRLALRRR
jgi:hypothetical protein